jgi:U3 small nucleolar RNA-associated protein 14
MARRGKRKSTGAGGQPETKASSSHRQPSIVEHVDDDDDEEIDEDEAFNSEDERMYGHFFTQKGDMDDSDVEEGTSDDDDDDDDDNDDDDDDDGQYMLSLLDKLESAGSKLKNPEKPASIAQMAKLPESEYSSSISKKGLTLGNLMQGLEDTQGFKNLQRTFATQETATPAPLDKVIADRTQRIIAYQSQSKNISRWTKAVQENRQAETLDFKPKERFNLTRDTLVDKFEPTTQFEKELEQALEEAGQKDEEAVLKAEEQALQDDLGANRLTIEEYKKRHGQLAQLRALMFYHEQKRHHIKKIKSKKYRKIRKKQRERLKEAGLEAAAADDADLAQELKEKEETARIQERMTLAHKNTSKWAKRVLKRGKNVDIETRRALSAQIQRGDDLRRKMMGDDKSDSDGDSDEDLVRSARQILEDDGPDPTRGKSGLFKLAFMQKGMMKQRDRAKDEARRLLAELQEDEDGDGIASPTEKNSGDVVIEQKNEVIASDQEMKKIMKGGALVASSLAFGNSTAISTSGGIEIDLNGNSNSTNHQDVRGVTTVSTEHVATFENKPVANGASAASEDKVKSEKESTSVQKVAQASTKRKAVDDEEANPWLQPSLGLASPAVASAGKASASGTKKKKSKKGMVDVEGAVDILDSGGSDLGHRSSSMSDTQKNPLPDTKITLLSQEELVRRAFASQSDKETEEEFRKEKEAMAVENDPTRKVAADAKDSKDVAGWGSWAGVGAPPPLRPRKLPKKLEPPKKKKDDQSQKRKDEGKPDVIINQKRLKRMANKFMLGDVPHPFASRAEYEEAMLGGVGREWNVTGSFKSMTRPEILTRSGKIIQPISKRAKVARAPAKF